MKAFLSNLGVVLVMALVPLAGTAQVRPGGPPGQRPQRQELERRLQQGFGTMVQNRLGLDRDALEALQGVMQSFREDRVALNRDQASLRHRLLSPALEDMGEEEALEVLAEMVRIQQAELDLYGREQRELLTVLDPIQLILFYRIREEWGQRIQQLRRGEGRSGGGGPPGTMRPSGGMGLEMDWDDLLSGSVDHPMPRF